MDIKKRNVDWEAVGSIFNVCADFKTVSDIQDLYTYLANGFNYMAMTDYPYSSSFLQPMPAWPVNASCKAFENVAPKAESQRNQSVSGLNDREKLVLNALKAASDIYFNYSGQIKCSNYSNTDATGSLDAEGWNVLACNQLAMPIDFGTKDSMFIEDLFNKTAYSLNC
jgi:Serine carboxypeptidase S28